VRVLDVIGLGQVAVVDEVAERGLGLAVLLGGWHGSRLAEGALRVGRAT
jgi:hypothetical protein